MQNLEKQLTKEDEKQAFERVKELAIFDQNTLELCLNYYLSYRSSSHVPNDKIALAMKCAFFMAEKCKETFNTKGQKIRGVAFSLNCLLKDHKLDDTMMLLKDFSKKVKIGDEQASQDLSSILKSISFLITFYTKFQKTIQKLDLKQKNTQNSGYIKIFTSYAWLLYVEAKNRVLNRELEIIRNTCLLAHVLSFMLFYARDFIKPQYFYSGDKRLTSESIPKEVSKIVLERILDIFCIKSVETFHEVAELFEDFFYILNEKGIVKMNRETSDFLHPQKIHGNYMRLDKHYQNDFNPQNIDERIFFKERAINLTPSKMTPFARQGHQINKTAKMQPKFGLTKENRTFSSHRVLNYDVFQKQMETTTKNIPMKDIKLPKTIMQSPSMVKVPLICSTPITASMEMFNYLNEKSKKIKDFQNLHWTYDKEAIQKTQLLLDNENKDQDKKARDVKRNMILALYKVSVMEYLNSNYQETQTQDLLKAFLTLCIELVFYVSNITITFEEIQEAIHVQPLQLWKAVNHYQKNDKSIPTNLKYHLLDIETQIISSKIWTKKELVIAISSMANGNDENISIDKLFRRVLHQIGFRISQLTSLLNIDDDVTEKVFDTMKQILLSHEELVYMRNIDQLILCAMFSNCKKAGYQIKFNNIKEVYEESNPNLKASLEAIVCRVYINENEKPLDIIKFYNSYFLTENLKKYIQTLHDGHQTNRNKKKNDLLASPLKAIIPSNINFKQKQKVNQNLKGNITPQTQLLYAYNESPILKYEMHSFKSRGNMKSKRVLDFEKEEEVTKPRIEQVHTPQINVQKDHLNQIFSKKIVKKGPKQNARTPGSHTPVSSHRSNHIEMGFQNQYQIRPQDFNNNYLLKTHKR